MGGKEELKELIKLLRKLLRGYRSRPPYGPRIRRLGSVGRYYAPPRYPVYRGYREDAKPKVDRPASYPKPRLEPEARPYRERLVYDPEVKEVLERIEGHLEELKEKASEPEDREVARDEEVGEEGEEPGEGEEDLQGSREEAPMPEVGEGSEGESEVSGEPEDAYEAEEPIEEGGEAYGEISELEGELYVGPLEAEEVEEDGEAQQA